MRLALFVVVTVLVALVASPTVSAASACGSDDAVDDSVDVVEDAVLLDAHNVPSELGERQTSPGASGHSWESKEAATSNRATTDRPTRVLRGMCSMQ